MMNTATATDPPYYHTPSLAAGLLQLGARLIGILDYDTLVQTILPDIIAACQGIDSGLLWLYDRRSTSLRLVASHGLGLDLRTVYPPLVSLHEGLAGQALRTGNTLSLHTQHGYRDLLEPQHPPPSRLINSIHDHLPGSINAIVIPLYVSAERFGVLEFFSLQFPPGPLFPDHESTLNAFGELIAAALRNARLYEQNTFERHKLSSVIASIAEGVALCDAQGHLVLANEAAMNMLSLDTVPYQQKISEMTDFYGIRDLDGTPLPIEQLPLARALSGEVFHDYRVLMRGASGHNSVMSFSGSPAYGDNDSVEGAVVVFRDITQHQKIERAKDEFLAIAAHELRSPLAAVRSYAEYLLHRTQVRNETDPHDLQGLTLLTQQVAHMLRMVDNLLDVSHIDTGQLTLEIKEINLVTLAQQVINQQRPTAQHNEFILTVAQPALMVWCDELRILQILTNFLSNAVKYGASDSRITVHIALAATPKEESTVVEAGCREAVLAVHNWGDPIPAQLQETIFNKFIRGRERHTDGLGLGLYLSREFVLLHGGRIWLESSAGHGTTFFFSLPIKAMMPL